MALLKVGGRKPDQVAEQPGPELELQDVLHDEKNEAAERRCGDADERQKRETQPKNDEKVGVAARNDLVHDNLHVSRGGQGYDLQDDRKDEDLNEGMAASAELAPEDRERKCGAF